VPHAQSEQMPGQKCPARMGPPVAVTPRIPEAGSKQAPQNVRKQGLLEEIQQLQRDAAAPCPAQPREGATGRQRERRGAVVGEGGMKSGRAGEGESVAAKRR